MYTIFSIIATTLLLPTFSTGQSTIVKPLNVGDTMPGIVIGNVANYNASVISFSDLRDKLLVLDFMTTGCTSCIKALPGFDSLQRVFANRLQIILVTPESQKQVAKFLQRKNIVGLGLPVIAGDTMLERLFPHTYIPHEVLIKSGRVISVTYPEYITAENIRKVLEGTNIKVPVKHDITDFGYNKPLLQLNQSNIPDFSYPSDVTYSTATSYMKDVPWGFTTVVDTLKKIIRISLINVPIVDMYVRAIYGIGLRPAFIVLNVQDTRKYAYDSNVEFTNEWLAQNTFCYQGSFPINYTLRAIRKKIGSDLDFFFQLKTHMEKRTLPVWVIIKDSSATVEPPSANNVKANVMHGSRISLNGIVYELNAKYGVVPTIDESGMGNLEIYGLSSNNYTNIIALRTKLKEYGLNIVYNKRVIDMLVIKECSQLKE